MPQSSKKCSPKSTAARATTAKPPKPAITDPEKKNDAGSKQARVIEMLQSPQNNLGEMYEKGKGVPQDYAAAVSWYRKAADQDNAYAQNNLADMYREGNGVPEDYAAAVSWYRKAADGGDDRAQRLLGLMYESGKGVPQDPVIALHWFNLAAGQGRELEELIRDMFAQKMTPAQIAEAQTLTMNWYRRAADQGNSDAQFNLALIYDKGQGVPQNYTTSVSLYRKAADQRDARAQNNLGEMYEKGKGMPQDYAAAVSWYRKAADQGNASA
ncbi:MAG: tetratricopeptide repeat protein, partial [Xanthobacteraceae bacterium]